MLVTMQMWPPPTPQPEAVSLEPLPPQSRMQPSTQPAFRSSPSGSSPMSEQYKRSPQTLPPKLSALHRHKDPPPSSLSPPPSPPPSPPILVVSQDIPPIRRRRTNSLRSSNTRSTVSTPQSPSLWSLFWSSGPPTKSKSTKSRSQSSATVYRTYKSRTPFPCRCSECLFPRHSHWTPPSSTQPEPKAPLSGSLSQFVARYPLVATREPEREKPKPEPVAAVVTDYAESNEKVEPIFELDSEQIFELE
jgi:hypothetical protein